MGQSELSPSYQTKPRRLTEGFLTERLKEEANDLLPAVEDPTQDFMARTLASYPHLNTIEKFHLRKRLGWCPYDEISELVPDEGVHLDIGCGYGHFLVYLAQVKPKLALIGCDPDPRKIEVARTSALARGGQILFGNAPCENFDGIPEELTSISLLDVLYLMPPDAQHRLLVWASRQLAHDGVLIIKTVDIEQGLRSKMAVWQEFLMVAVLQQTLSSGTWAAGQTLIQYMDKLQALRFNVHSNRLSDTRTPALLICAKKYTA
jgi:SAM-dependent methyltransferase